MAVEPQRKDSHFSNLSNLSKAVLSNNTPFPELSQISNDSLSSSFPNKRLILPYSFIQQQQHQQQEAKGTMLRGKENILKLQKIRRERNSATYGIADTKEQMEVFFHGIQINLWALENDTILTYETKLKDR